MKILYISPENTAGTLNLWKLAHESKGNECTFITLFKSKQNFENGICLNLPLINTNSLYMTVRNNYYKIEIMIWKIRSGLQISKNILLTNHI